MSLPISKEHTLHRKTFLLFALIVFISMVCFNCASSRHGITISMSSELKGKDNAVSGAWLGYGMKKALWRTKTYFENNPSASTYHYSFSEEVDCRKTLAQMWCEMKRNNGPQDQYLDDLARVVSAGFIAEYAWYYIKKADWMPPDSLREEQFQSWARKNIPNHNFITLAYASSYEEDSVMTSSVRQQELLNKAIDEMYKERYKKAESLLGQLVSGMPANWQAFSEIGDSIFYAFWDTAEQNQCARENPQRTVVPIFPSYSRAFYLLGFIAMEAGNAEKALSQLDKALSLQPNHPVILLEKAGVLLKLKRPKEAYECFVLAEKPHYGSSSFILARASRGQGVALIDLGRLDEAEVCLDKSLKYEPDSKSTLNEIEYIRQLRAGATPTEVKIHKVK
jgi:tetratricopeptide (TPR) repeat protein